MFSEISELPQYTSQTGEKSAQTPQYNALSPGLKYQREIDKGLNQQKPDP